MGMENVFEIDVDIKQKTAIKKPTVTQNDAVVFVFRIFDEGRIYNIENGTAFTLLSTRPDKQNVMKAGMVKSENIVEFKLGTTELEVVGKVDAVIQVYDADGRVSTIPFSYEVLNDPSTGYVPSEQEETLIQQVLGEGPEILADAKQATTDANTATLSANEAATNATAAADNANTVASELEQLKTDSVSATQNANEAAQLANTAASEAQTATANANQATQNADTATSEATTAAELATEAGNNAQALVDSSVHKREYDPTVAYVVNNEVRYEGSTWRCMQDCTGVTPAEGEYWTSVAQKGIDGKGSVSSVNGVGPDGDGNVTIEIPEPDLSGYATTVEFESHETDESAHGIGDKSTLETTEKGTIVGAINELFTFADNGKTALASVVGSPATANDTFQALSDLISTDGTSLRDAIIVPEGTPAVTELKNSKVALATNLTDKGHPSLDSESLWDLVNKVSLIETGGGTGITGTVTSTDYIEQFQYGNGTSISKYFVEVNDIGFPPSFIFLRHQSSSDLTIYAKDPSINDNYPNYRGMIIPVIPSSVLGAQVQGIRVGDLPTEGFNAFVNENGFKLPVHAANKTYIWKAFP